MADRWTLPDNFQEALSLDNLKEALVDIDMGMMDTPVDIKVYNTNTL